jgi:hypothetical protein
LKQSKKVKSKQVEQLTSFSKKLAAPLHTLATRELQLQALDQFNKLNGLLGVKSKQSDTITKVEQFDQSLQTYLDVLFTSPALVDEIYAHTIKQLNNLPDK